MNGGRSWLVYTHGGGRLGNQVLRWAHWMAWARDFPERVGVVNLAFWPYAQLFEGSCRRLGCAQPGNIAALDRLAAARDCLPEWILSKVEWRAQHVVHALGQCVPGAERLGRRLEHDLRIDLDGEGFADWLSGNRVTTCAGWRIAGWERVRRRREELRAYFRPAGGRAQQARDFVSALRARWGRVIGVLIRQGDYLTWQGGRFGYPTFEYVRWMREILEMERGRVGFLIASDTVQETARFAGLPHAFSNGSANAGGPAIASFAELAECDVVLSPPSTFAATAAFVGGRPLWPVCERGQVLAREQILAEGLLDAAKHPICSLVVK